MGCKDDKGLIPRLCDDLFERIARNEDSNTSYKVEVSYMEIYNEKVHDLLDISGNKQQLRVREHNIMGEFAVLITCNATGTAHPNFPHLLPYTAIYIAKAHCARCLRSDIQHSI